MIATSTINCSYFNPLLSDGVIPSETKLPFQFSSSTCQVINSVNSSTTISSYNGFTAGEIVISLFVFWIFLFLIFNFIAEKFIGFFHKK
jgi:hypothetical protein